VVILFVALSDEWFKGLSILLAIMQAGFADFERLSTSELGRCELRCEDVGSCYPGSFLNV